MKARPAGTALLTVAATLFGFEATGAAPAPARGGADTATTAYAASGVRVIQRRTDRSDIVSVRLYLLGGSRQLERGTEGIEALLARAGEIACQDALSAAGARSILGVAYDWTVTGFQTLRPNLADAWAAWAPGVVAPPTSGPSMIRARDEMLADARRRSGDPAERVHALAWANAFANHPYALDPRGTERSIPSMSAADLGAYVQEQMVRSRMLLVVVGDVDPDTVSALVTGTLGTLPGGTYAWSAPPPVPERPPRIAYEDRSLPTNYLLGYVIGPPPTDDAYDAFEIATNLLASRLHQVVRTEHSLSYAASAAFNEGGIPTAAVSATSADPAQVYDLMLEQLTWLQSLSRMPGWALSHFIDQFTLDELGRELTNDAQGRALARAELYLGDYRLADRHIQRLRRVSPNDIRSVALRYMRVLHLGYVGNKRLMRFE